MAYLSEQHASQVRDELRKAAAAAKGSSATPSPIPGSEALGHQRVPSALSVRKDFPFPRNEASGSGTPIESSFRPGISRNSSGNSPAYSHNLGGVSTPRPVMEGPRTGETLAQRQRMSSLPVSSPNPPSPGPADTSSEESDDSSPAQSRIIRRPPRFQSQDEPRGYGDDDEDVEPAFQAANRGSSDLNATVRGGRAASRGPNRDRDRGRMHQSHTSESSTGSAAVVPRRSKSGGRLPSGPSMSPRAVQPAGRSPGGKGKEASREGSDGTPSMGSSFSDLDGMFPLPFAPFWGWVAMLTLQFPDSSVTQSAMAEALASGMQDGAMGSRFSLAQSLSRRFVPRRGN